MNKILFLDIDDTLLIGDNIYIYLIKDGIKRKITTHEYSNLTLTNLKERIDYSEFDDPEKIKNSIINGKPLLHNLKKIDEYVKNGWELGVLTARGEQRTIRKVIKEWLKDKLKNEFILKEKNIYAVGDRIINYPGKNSSERKVKILKKYLLKFDRVCLIDDSQKTINYIKETNRNESLTIEYIQV